MKNLKFLFGFSFILFVALVAIRENAAGYFVQNSPTSIRQAQDKMDLPLASVTEPIAKASTPLLRRALPSLDLMRAEAQADPHAIPASLLDFSVVVAGKMKEARVNQIYAEALFAELRLCAAEGPEASQSTIVRAYCLGNAKRLVGWHPELEDLWQRLAGQVGSALMELVEVTPG